jgi:hypothetical protein
MLLTKKQEKAVEKEVRKRLRERIMEKTKSSALEFKREVKKHTATAITAAFAFLIALSWRDPIKKSVNSFIESLGLVGKEIYFEYTAAFLITVIEVLALMLISKWTAEN